jgi:cytochrome b6-f complex iron-sulfur subunit
MSDPREQRTADRVDRLAADVLAGRHLKATPSDAGERDAIRVAARLAGSRDGFPRMTPAFRRRLSRLLEKGEAPSWMDRRSALVAGLGLAVGAVAGILAEQATGLGGPRTSAPGPAPRRAVTSRAMIEPARDVARWYDTGLRLEDLKENEPHRVSAGSVGAFLLRQGGTVVAMSAYCTHLPCELAWLPARRVLNCPCHNQAFDLDGSATPEGLPALPLVRARVRADGHVEVLGT